MKNYLKLTALVISVLTDCIWIWLVGKMVHLNLISDSKALKVIREAEIRTVLIAEKSAEIYANLGNMQKACHFQNLAEHYREEYHGDF